MTEKDNPESQDQTDGPRGAGAEAQDYDEILKLLDGDSASPKIEEAAPEAEAEMPDPDADPVPTPEPTSVFEMLRQASESLDTREGAAKAAEPAASSPASDPPASDPLGTDPLGFDETDAPAEPEPEPAVPLYESDPDGYAKAQSWLDGEGTTSAPGASLGRVRNMRSTLRGRPEEEPDTAEEAAPVAEASPRETDDPLERLRLARERLRESEAGKAPQPKRIPAQPRDAVRRAKAEAESSWKPSAADRKAARKTKGGAKRKKAAGRAAKPRGGERQSGQRVPEGWPGRVAMLISLVLAAVAVQIGIMGKLGVGFGPKDLATGLSAVFPVFFIMLVVRPKGFKQWAVVVSSCAAIVVVGSVVYGVSLWLGRAGPLSDIGFSVGLAVVLCFYLLTWGPLFLFVISILTRMDLWFDDRVQVMSKGG